MSNTVPPSEDRRAAAEHPWLEQTVRRAVELVGGELPEFDAALRRRLLAGYRAAEGTASGTPGSRAKGLLLTHEALFRSTLPRILSICVDAEFRRLGGWPSQTPRPDSGSPARVAAVRAFARQVPVDGPDGLAELGRRIAHRLARDAALAPGVDPLRPEVFAHAVGLCWRTVAGTDRDEIEVINGYVVLWMPSLRRAIPLLVAGIPPVDGPGPALRATDAARRDAGDAPAPPR